MPRYALFGSWASKRFDKAPVDAAPPILAKVQEMDRKEVLPLPPEISAVALLLIETGADRDRQVTSSRRVCRSVLADGIAKVLIERGLGVACRCAGLATCGCRLLTETAMRCLARSAVQRIATMRRMCRYPVTDHARHRKSDHGFGAPSDRLRSTFIEVLRCHRFFEMFAVVTHKCCQQSTGHHPNAKFMPCLTALRTLFVPRKKRRLH